jgi:ABC-type Fe3+-hydroxamate transport system substrate-binding protein
VELRHVRRVDARELQLQGPPGRIVSLVPSHTETLFAIGAGARVVGVTDYCIHPADAVQRVARVGGTKTPAIERIRALEPDLVIANREENRRIDVQRLEAAGLRVLVTYARSVGEARAEIALLASVCACEAGAARLLDGIDAALRGSEERGRRTRTVALIWKDPYMAIGGDCFANDLLERAGGQNPFACERRRYPHVDAGRIASAQPQVILLPTEPYAFAERERDELQQLDCPAARSGRIEIIEGELLTWYGPRIPRALITLAALLRSDRPSAAG